MNNLFVEPRPVTSSDDHQIMASSPIVSASTPLRRFSLHVVPSLFTASPLILRGCHDKPRSMSTNSPEPFALNNLSLCNDSGINECSFAMNPAPKCSVRSLNKELLDETPPGIMFDEEKIEALPDSDDEDEEPVSSKRGLSDSYIALKEKSPSVPKMKRQSGELLPRVPNCMDSSYNEAPLIGNNSREYLLPYEPYCNSEHCDFKCITPHTMADLLSGKHDNEVEDYLIIDTRYPYEYEGGHVRGAVNVVTKEDMSLRYLSNPTIQYSRQVVIFHCEFSSKRGPRMCRFVRDQDRLLNTHHYPTLFYPEIYILHGGYKDFFPLFRELCVPRNYVLMLDPAFEEQLTYWQKTTKQTTGTNAQANVRGLKSRTKSHRQLLLP